MNTAVITVKTPADIKIQAQDAAKELGFSLSSLINAYLRQLIKTKTVHFSLEEPTPYLLESLQASKRDVEHGYVSPGFTNVDDAIAWLHEKEPQYENQIQQEVQKTT